MITLKSGKTMFTIQVIESSTGKPAYYKKVQVFFNGWTRGHTRELYTDKNGEAHFDYDNGEGQIYVGSERMYEGSISGRKVVYI